MTFTCHICLITLENKPSVCVPSCGHVFHQECARNWILVKKAKTCPKCRAPMPSEKVLIKLYFGESLEDNFSKKLRENQMCRKKIELLLQEVNKNLKIIDENTKEISMQMSTGENEKDNESDNETRVFKLKGIAVLLSRAEEEKKIREYYENLNN